MGLVATTSALALTDPAGWTVLLIVLVASIAFPMVAQQALVERDLRARSLAAGLSRFYLDTLRGLIAVRTHCAERSVRGEHEALLVEWVRAMRALQRTNLSLEASQSLIALFLAGSLVIGYLSRRSDTEIFLLLLFWALTLPLLAQELAYVARQYPTHRNVTLRLLEVLSAPEEKESEAPSDIGSETFSRGVAIVLDNATVCAGKHELLTSVSTTIEAGSHVAIVGASGAGKSTFIGVFLGWHYAARGSVIVDGMPLNPQLLSTTLRPSTVWLDPSVQLWKGSVFGNLTYGSTTPPSMDRIVAEADLQQLLGTLPDGLQTTIGEGGGLLSAGEGQRLRFGRAMCRPFARLVLLDEPFRALPRRQRETFLSRARALWKDATLLCVTQDVGEARLFDRVLVFDNGRLVEEGTPDRLAANVTSRYARMLAAERVVRDTMWSSTRWKRLVVRDGRVSSAAASGHAT